MRVRYRRGRVERGDNAAAVAASVAIGAGVAAVSFYLMRLFLAREPLSPTVAEASDADARALPAQGGASGESAD